MTDGDDLLAQRAKQPRLRAAPSLYERMEPGYPDRFMELFEKRGEPATVIDGTIFKLYEGMVIPFGPADADYSLPRAEASRVLRSLGGKVLRTTTGFHTDRPVSDWYAVICRAFTPIESVSSSKTRYELRRALRNCEVGRMSCEELARSGYEVYRRAFDRYSGSEAPVASSAFEAHVMAGDGFDDVIHHWAVRCDGELAGYATNYSFGEAEVAHSAVKLHPDYLKRNTSYALFHRMNEFYLGEGRVASVNDGFRAIRHPTGLERFLERNFAFEKIYTGVDVVYRQPYATFVRATYPFRNLIGKLDERARAIYELERVARATRMRA
jgi:hypothetical protein